MTKTAPLHRPKRQVCLIEDHQDYRRVLQHSINLSGHLSCELVFSSIESFSAGTGHRPPVDVVLLDLGLPGMNGVEGIGVIQKVYPEARILVLTVYDHKPVVFQALASGAGGYLLKSDPMETIIRGIDEALDGGAPLNRHVSKMILATFKATPVVKPVTDLTERERGILTLLSRGMIKKEIADHLGVSYHTVDSHVRNIYAKLKVQNVSGAVAWAIKLGLT